MIADCRCLSIELASIPTHMKTGLAAATLEGLKRFKQQPGGQEALNAKIAAMKKERK